MTFLLAFLLPLLALFLLTAVSVRLLLPYLMSKKLGQRILDIGPRWHKSKEGTPTMGGLAFLPVSLLFLGGALLFLLLTERGAEALPLLLTLCFALLHAAIGVFDDLRKFKKQQNEGLSPGQKLILQAAVTAVYLFFMRYFGFLHSETVIPFFGVTVDLGFFFDFAVLFISVGIINCANLTDGVDGLLSSVTVPIGLSYALIAALFINDGAFLLSLLLIALPAGFLCYNLHPARLFMGDTGSLFFGALTVGGAILLDRPLLLLVIPFVFIVEGVSDVIQVVYFKISGGKRIFKMAPLHHHMEASGKKEGAIVLRFLLISCLAAALGAVSLLREVM